MSTIHLMPHLMGEENAEREESKVPKRRSRADVSKKIGSQLVRVGNERRST